jgi:CRISPR/Cas system-associated exonuclease Cas4 (RecB family)
MMAGLAFLIFIALVAVFAAQWWRSQNWLPSELRNGKLIAIEKSLHTDVPYPVTGRFDRVYQLASGQHAPLEYKNRDITRLFESDRAQLSLQAWVLRRNGKPTAPFGFLVVRERKTGQKKAVKVDLGDDAYCERLIRRHIEVRSGRAKPNRARDGRCKACGHRDVC